MTSFTGRMIGAAMLDKQVFEEIEADSTGTTQALLVVVIAGVAAGIGSARFGITATLTSSIFATIGWFINAGLIYVVGTKLIPGSKTQADLGQVLRVVGFAAAPGLLQVVGIIPCAGTLVAMGTWIWTLAATIVGVHCALDHDGYGRTIAVCLVGWVAWMVLMSIVAMFGFGSAVLGRW